MANREAPQLEAILRTPDQPARLPAMKARATRRGVLLGGFCLCCLPGKLRASDAGPLAMEEIADGIHSNYPPAEPGALFSVSRSKRLEGDADASPAHCAT